jgi:putative tryptophan/tyrosine transport system substrate-binding protein
MLRREFVALLAGTVASAWSLAVHAQQNTAIKRIGFLYPGPVAASQTRIASVLAGLRYSGFRVPDQALLVSKIADGDPKRLTTLMAELIDEKVDVIVSIGTAALLVARSATSSVPIVAHDLDTDPVAGGVIQSLSHPGGNITGFFFAFPEFRKKWVEVLKEAIPNLNRVAVLWDPATGSSQVKAVEDAARVLGLKLEVIEGRRREDIEGAFITASRLDVGALLMLSSPVLGADMKSIADLAMRHRLPALAFFSEFARAGGLISYGPNLLDTYRQLGGIVAKVLRGALPADVPAELPTKFELIVNLRTAEALGLTVAASVLLRADEVIE